MIPAYLLGCTSEWHSEGQEFEPPWLHHLKRPEMPLFPLRDKGFLGFTQGAPMPKPQDNYLGPAKDFLNEKTSFPLGV